MESVVGQEVVFDNELDVSVGDSSGTVFLVWIAREFNGSVVESIAEIAPDEVAFVEPDAVGDEGGFAEAVVEAFA